MEVCEWGLFNPKKEDRQRSNEANAASKEICKRTFANRQIASNRQMQYSAEDSGQQQFFSPCKSGRNRFKSTNTTCFFLFCPLVRGYLQYDRSPALYSHSTCTLFAQPIYTTITSTHNAHTKPKCYKTYSISMIFVVLESH